jgi:hypothetical protein
VRTLTPYLHALDGRMRINVPLVKGAPHKAAEIEDQLAALCSIDQVAANPVTGNVLIIFDPGRTSVAEIVDALWATGYLRPAPAALPPSLPVDLAGLLVRATTELALQKLIMALI